MSAQFWSKPERSGSNKHELFCEYLQVAANDSECTPKQEDVLNILVPYKTMMQINNGCNSYQFYSLVHNFGPHGRH